jgi:hypothetical protein
VRAVDWERRGSEGGTPRKGRREVAPAKSQPESYGERQLGEVALGSGGSGGDEKRMGRNGDGTASVTFEKRLGGMGQRGKKGGRRGRIHMEEGEGGEGGLARRWVARGGRQRPPTVGRGRRHCCTNRGGWQEWATG